MSLISRNFLLLALDDYLAARLLLRNGLLPQGTALAATAVEKHLKAVLALDDVYTKRHLGCSGLLTLVGKRHPDLASALNRDFMKFLDRAFRLRYASVDGTGFNMVLNQHRTLIELDKTMIEIDSGFKVEGADPLDATPLREAVRLRKQLLFEDNVPLGGISLQTLSGRQNKMHEIRVADKLRTLTVEYETDTLQIVGDFCKSTDIDYKQTFCLALG
jgi:HEPN domain-containing protein